MRPWAMGLPRPSRHLGYRAQSPAPDQTENKQGTSPNPPNLTGMWPELRGQPAGPRDGSKCKRREGGTPVASGPALRSTPGADHGPLLMRGCIITNSKLSALNFPTNKTNQENIKSELLEQCVILIRHTSYLATSRMEFPLPLHPEVGTTQGCALWDVPRPLQKAPVQQNPQEEHNCAL